MYANLKIGMHLDDVKARLEETVPVIKEEAQSAFDMIKGIK